MKRLLSSLLLLCLLSGPTQAAGEIDFDLQKDSGLAVHYFYEEGIMTGDENVLPVLEALALDREVNRAEFLKVLLTALDVPAEGSNCYDDVSDQWFAPYVCAAASRGWVNGYPDGLFRPDRSINEWEGAKILQNAELSTIAAEDLAHLLTREEAAHMIFKAKVASQADEGVYSEAARNVFLVEEGYAYPLAEHSAYCENNDIPFESPEFSHGEFSFSGSLSYEEAWFYEETLFYPLYMDVETSDSMAYLYFWDLTSIGNTINAPNAEGKLRFKLGLINEGEFESSADFDEATKAAIEAALDSGESIGLDFTLPYYYGAGAPMDFSFACKIELSE